MQHFKILNIDDFYRTATELFVKCDPLNTGSIRREQLKTVLPDFSEHDLALLMQKFKVDQRGEIPFDVFASALNSWIRETVAKKYDKTEDDEMLLEGYGLIDSNGLIYQSDYSSAAIVSSVSEELKQIQRYYKELREKCHLILNHGDVLENENTNLHQPVITLEKLKSREQILKARVKELGIELENYKQKNKDEVSTVKNQNKKVNQEKINHLEQELSQAKKNLEEAQQQQIALQPKTNSTVTKPEIPKEKPNETVFPKVQPVKDMTPPKIREIEIIQPVQCDVIKESVFIEDYLPSKQKSKITEPTPVKKEPPKLEKIEIPEPTNTLTIDHTKDKTKDISPLSPDKKNDKLNDKSIHSARGSSVVFTNKSTSVVINRNGKSLVTSKGKQLVF